MKTNKSKLLVLLALVSAFVLAMSCLFITACKPEEEQNEKFAILWVLPEGVTASVEGHDALPTEWVKDANLEFTVTAPQGYTPTVRAYSTITPKDGKYSFKVTRDATVTVTIERTLTGIAVTANPTKLDGYFTADSLDTAGMVVTATYAVGDPETVATGYTVVHGKVNAENVFTASEDSTKFANGDNAFQITYKGLTSAPVKLTNPAEDPFGFTAVDIEVGEDGKPYYVLTGTYGVSIEEQFKHVGFDFQVQGGYSTGGWAYTNYNIVMNDEDLVDGVFTLRVDMSALSALVASNNVSSMLFLPHMGFNPPGDNSGNYDVKTDDFENGKTITAGDYKYSLYFEAYQSDGSNGATTSYDMVGVIVSDANYVPTSNYALGDVTLDSFGLEVRDSKPVMVINGSVSNYVENTEEQRWVIYLATVNNGATDGTGSYGTTVITSNAVITYTNVVEAAGENPATADFEIVWDASDLAVGKGVWFHLGQASNDLNGQNMTAGKESVTVGGKTYTLVPQGADSTNSPELKATAAETGGVDVTIKAAYESAGYNVDLTADDIDASLKAALDAYAQMGYSVSYIGKNLESPNYELYMLFGTDSEASADTLATSLGTSFKFAKNGSYVIVSVNPLVTTPNFAPFNAAFAE